MEKDRSILWIRDRLIWRERQREQSRRRAFWQRLPPRETMGTLWVGTASVALAIVMFIVTMAGLSGFPVAQWSEPWKVMVEAKPRSFTSEFDPRSNTYVHESVLVASGTIWLPSPDCDRLAWPGLVLGAIGLAMSLRRGELSWLSAVGFTVTLLMMNFVVACGTLMTLVPSR